MIQWALIAAVVGYILLRPSRALGYVNGVPTELELGPIGGGLSMRVDAAAAFRAMRDAAADVGVYLVTSGPRSAFRTTEQQESLQVDRADYAAPVNRSPHQAGIAVDLETANGTNAAYRWLLSNGRMFGFVGPYPAREPWHWEYRA